VIVAAARDEKANDENSETQSGAILVAKEFG
jgi:hypothetical protein